MHIISWLDGKQTKQPQLAQVSFTIYLQRYSSVGEKSRIEALESQTLSSASLAPLTPWAESTANDAVYKSQGSGGR